MTLSNFNPSPSCRFMYFQLSSLLSLSPVWVRRLSPFSLLRSQKNCKVLTTLVQLVCPFSVGLTCKQHDNLVQTHACTECTATMQLNATQGTSEFCTQTPWCALAKLSGSCARLLQLCFRFCYPLWCCDLCLSVCSSSTRASHFTCRFDQKGKRCQIQSTTQRLKWLGWVV